MGSFVEELLKTLAQEVIKKGYDKWSQRKPKMDVCENCPNCGKAFYTTLRSIEKDKQQCPGCQADLNRDAMREQAQRYLAILNVEIQATCKKCGKAVSVTPELGKTYKCTDCGTPFLYDELYAFLRK